MPLIMIVSAFAALAGGGGAPRASIFMGKGQNEDAEKTLAGCFSLLSIIAVVLTTVLLIWSEDLLLAFGASGETIRYAVDYMSIYAIGTIFVQLTLGMNAFITAQGFAKQGMFSVLIGAVCNIALDPVFIFGFGMGVKGAALATILSQAASCVWVLLFLTGKTTILKLKLKNLNLKPSIVLPCVALGMATFIMQSTESVISVCFNTSLLKYGGDMAVGAMTILTSVMQFAMLPMQGIGQGAQPIMSFNYGAGDADRVRKTYRMLLTVSLSYSLVIWACIMLMPQVFAGIFTPDAAMREFTAKALRVYCAGLGLFGIQIACQMAFVSLGQALCSMTVAIMRKFVLLLPLIYLMPAIMENKTMAVYTAEPVADVLAVTFTAILFFFVFRKAMKKLEDKKLAE
jgi:putative MATE family efflux protein